MRQRKGAMQHLQLTGCCILFSVRSFGLTFLSANAGKHLSGVYSTDITISMEYICGRLKRLQMHKRQCKAVLQSAHFSSAVYSSISRTLSSGNIVSNCST